MSKMYKRLPTFLFALAGLIFLFSSSAHAQAPRLYYDWSSTLETKKQTVLGIANAYESTSSAVQPTTSQTSTSQNSKQFNRYFIGGNLTPDNPFHFIKTFQENALVNFTFDPEKKEKLRLKIAGERLDEIKDLTDSGKTAVLEKALIDYGKVMEETADNTEKLKFKANISDLVKEIEQDSAKHTIVLEQVSLKVPENAKDAIGKAIEASFKGTDTASDLLNRPAVPTDVVSRIQALKAQGLITEEEATKLISVKTREEAREELKKYVNAGILPEADFLRLNENVKNLYPDEFYKIYEMKRFYEMKKLETEKPDETTLAKIQEFAKTYKPGDIIPSDIRKYWIPVIRLEEIQNTLRPDLIDAQLLKGKQSDYQKFMEVVERFKPRPEDIVYLEDYLKKNPDAKLPPEYERMKELGEKYGASCGADKHWEPKEGGSGICVPNDMKFEDKEKYKNLSAIEEFAKGKACNGQIVAAKRADGICSAYPSDCLPSGFSRVSTCADTLGNTKIDVKQISCPSNSHFVSIPYMSNGGYCIPNYTPTNYGEKGVGQTETPCPSGYYRSYSSGPCYSSTSVREIPRISPNGDAYPNPIYPPSLQNRCSEGYRWVTEQTGGGYCMSETPTLIIENKEKWEKPGGCKTKAECYDYCKVHPNEGVCKNMPKDQPRPDDNEKWEDKWPDPQSVCAKAGGTWTNNYCKMPTPSNPPPGYGDCANWDSTRNVCVNSSYQSPTPAYQSKTPEQIDSQPTSAPQPQPTGQPAPTSAPEQPRQEPTQTMDPSSECSKYGGSWTGSYCKMPGMQ